MKLGYDNCFALIIYKGAAEIVRVRKDRGVGHSLFKDNDYLLSIDDYQEELDIHTWSNSHYIESVHVVATAARADLLPPITSVAVPSKAEVDSALPAIQIAINDGGLSQQMRDYLKALLTEENRYTIAYPFAGKASSGFQAIILAVQKMASWEASLFAGMELRIRETLSSAEAPDGGRRTADFATRVRDAVALPQAAASHEEPARVEPVPVDPAEVQRQCKDDLQKVLAETMAKIAEIDRRLIDAGPVPAWRDTMNEVFETAMQVSRTLDYAPDDPQPVRRRGR